MGSARRRCRGRPRGGRAWADRGRGKGVRTPRSDWDGLLVVADSALSRWSAAVPAGLDVSVLAESDWPAYAEPGTAFAWRGYDLAEMVGAWLEAVFAHHPLRLVSGDVLRDVGQVLAGDLAAAWRLEGELSAACRQAGVTDELDGWAGHLAPVRPGG